MYSALHLAQLSREAYDRKDFEVRNIEGIQANDVFAFRGTDEVSDAVRSLRVFPWYTDSMGWSVAGYVKAAKRSTRLVLERADKNIVLTGHSLGGAIALLVGAMLITQGVGVTQIVTFGAPRVGRLRGVLDGVNVSQYKHGRDIVTSVPPWLRHPKKQTVLTSNGWHPVRDHYLDGYIKGIKRGSTP